MVSKPSRFAMPWIWLPKSSYVQTRRLKLNGSRFVLLAVDHHARVSKIYKALPIMRNRDPAHRLP